MHIGLVASKVAEPWWWIVRGKFTPPHHLRFRWLSSGTLHRGNHAKLWSHEHHQLSTVFFPQLAYDTWGCDSNMSWFHHVPSQFHRRHPHLEVSNFLTPLLSLYGYNIWFDNDRSAKHLLGWPSIRTLFWVSLGCLIHKHPQTSCWLNQNWWNDQFWMAPRLG